MYTADSFVGRNVIITGANTGIGFEAALKLIQCNAAKVIIAVRTISKGETAQWEIESRIGRKGVIEVWQLDMLNYASIKAFANRVTTELDRLDYAILNAGVIPASFEQSTYGWETTLQVNTISTVLLSLLLLPKLKASKRDDAFTPVLELISSGTHQRAQLHPEVSDTEQNPLQVYNNASVFSPQAQYGLSKLYLMYCLPHLVKLADSRVHVFAVCPGATKSDLARNMIANYPYLKPVLLLMYLFIFKSAEQGSRIYLSGLMLGDKGNGRFYQYDQIQEPAALLVGKEAEARGDRVWSAVVETLAKEVEEVKYLAAR